LAEHLAARVGRHGLGDRYEFHSRLPQLADVKFGMKRIAAESAQRMDNDKRKGSVGPRGLVDHLLEDGPVVVKRGSSRFAEDLDDFPPLTLAVRATLRDLVRERK